MKLELYPKEQQDFGFDLAKLETQVRRDFLGWKDWNFIEKHWDDPYLNGKCLKNWYDPYFKLRH